MLTQLAVGQSWPLDRAGRSAACPSAPYSRNKPVAYTVDRAKVNGICGVSLEFLAQSHDVIVHCSGAGVIVVPPHLVEQFVTRNGSLSIDDQKSEDFEFQRGKQHLFAPPRDPHAIKVDGDFPEGHSVV